MREAFLEGYMHKTAAAPAAAAAAATAATVGGKALSGAAKGVGAIVDAGARAAEASTNVAAELLPYAIAIPILFGGAVGYAHSALTSPAPQDLDTAQKALVSAEMDEMLTNLRRRKAQSVKAGEEERKKNERTLHI